MCERGEGDIKQKNWQSLRHFPKASPERMAFTVTDEARTALRFHVPRSPSLRPEVAALAAL
ncbi:hypothetical protein IscW_ISCW006997 [Ixodes scapularis]|uniref:Uncharacterized protein n=1 Tax=Ixodes scapularis TaxID=6945 RepID=B7PT18_IXOSC|nr:hypothetical protein IscW_ISCW006997 [Ixodes scapularis]|eukprot:XP_002403645.1 hypothetical protein IscW_ISCW006997 [Ixodes scapularis]